MDNIVYENIFGSVFSSRSFADRFFSKTLYQQFNDRSLQFASDENEPAIRKYLRAMHQLH